MAFQETSQKRIGNIVISTEALVNRIDQNLLGLQMVMVKGTQKDRGTLLFARILFICNNFQINGTVQ
jgi:hypothetical protein